MTKSEKELYVIIKNEIYMHTELSNQEINMIAKHIVEKCEKILL